MPVNLGHLPTVRLAKPPTDRFASCSVGSMKDNIRSVCKLVLINSCIPKASELKVTLVPPVEHCRGGGENHSTHHQHNKCIYIIFQLLILLVDYITILYRNIAQ